MVYLIHFEEHFKHAQHYIGFTEKSDVNERIDHHRDGSGGKLMRVVTEAGIEWKVVRIWDKGDRNFERSLKNRKKAAKLCPICNPKTFNNNAK